jgi:hypothetical protein
VDDGLSLGTIEKRPIEQDLFLKAFEKSILRDKRIVCTTDRATGDFKPRSRILGEVLA